MPAKLKERAAARLEPREKASLTPRVAKAAATLTTATEVNKRGVGASTDGNTAVEQPTKEEPTEDKPNKEDDDVEGKGGGKGGRGGGPGLPSKDDPETPDLKPGPNKTPGRYSGLTMTEAGLLIEQEADQPKLTAEDIEELRWAPNEMDKGWGREIQKSILKYVENRSR